MRKRLKKLLALPLIALALVFSFTFTRPAIAGTSSPYITLSQANELIGSAVTPVWFAIAGLTQSAVSQQIQINNLSKRVTVLEKLLTPTPIPTSTPTPTPIPPTATPTSTPTPTVTPTPIPPTATPTPTTAPVYCYCNQTSIWKADDGTCTVGGMPSGTQTTSIFCDTSCTQPCTINPK